MIEAGRNLTGEYRVGVLGEVAATGFCPAEVIDSGVVDEIAKLALPIVLGGSRDLNVALDRIRELTGLLRRIGCLHGLDVVLRLHAFQVGLRGSRTVFVFWLNNVANAGGLALRNGDLCGVLDHVVVNLLGMHTLVLGVAAHPIGYVELAINENMVNCVVASNVP